MTNEQRSRALDKYFSLRAHWQQLCGASRGLSERQRQAFDRLHTARLRLDQLTGNRGRACTYLTSGEAKELIAEQQRTVDDAQAEADRLKAEAQALQDRASEASAIAARCRDHLRDLGVPWGMLE